LFVGIRRACRKAGGRKATVWEVPEVRVAVMVVLADWPCVTVRDEGEAERVKSKEGTAEPNTLISAALV
jgi:hypothetical protein